MSTETHTLEKAMAAAVDFQRYCQNGELELAIDQANVMAKELVKLRGIIRPADYELPPWQAQHLTVAQRDRLQTLCDRFHVRFNPDHFRVYADDASMMKGYAEGWIGNAICIGVEPNGDSHS